jgi:hypothetical protein
MLSSLLRPKKGRSRVEEHSPFSSRGDRFTPVAERRKRLDAQHASADFTETELDDDENTEEEEDEEGGDGGEQDGNGAGDEDGNADHSDDEGEGEGDEDEDGQEDTPLLPIFSAAHLGTSPLPHTQVRC